MTCVGTKCDWDIIQKLVFISNNANTSAPPNSFSTFSAPFTSIIGTKYQQPWFGGNYIEVSFKPTADGGLPVGAIATCQLRVDGGLYEFYATLQQRIEAAMRKRQEFITLREYLIVDQ